MNNKKDKSSELIQICEYLINMKSFLGNHIHYHYYSLKMIIMLMY
jgi:hypothetical protein